MSPALLQVAAASWSPRSLMESLGSLAFAPSGPVAALPGSLPGAATRGGPPAFVTLDFAGADIQDVLKALALQSRCNIMVAPGVEGKVTVSLRNVPPDRALAYVVRLAGLAYGREDTTFVVGSPDQIRAMFPLGGRGQILFLPGDPAAGGSAPTAPSAPQVRVVQTGALPPAEALALVRKLAPGIQTETREPDLVVLIGPAEQVQAAEAALKTVIAAAPAERSAEPARLAAPEDVQIETYVLKHVSAADAGRIMDGFMRSGVLPRVVITPAPEPAFPMAEGELKTSQTLQQVADPTQALASLIYGSKPPVRPGPAGAAPGAREGAAAEENGGTVAIPAGSTTNTLLLIGSREDIARVRTFLDRVDVAPRQLMIDLKVTDVALNELNRLGVTWSWGKYSIRELTPGGDVAPNLQFGRFGHVPATFDATLEAMITKDKARMLANPKIAVLDGRTARIHVGDKVRYLAQRTAGLSGTTVTIDSVDVGVVVQVTPRIGGDDVITLDVRPEVKVITGYTPTGDGGQVPNTSERSVNTVVRLRDGETFVIGGLIRDEDVDAMQKVPGLGDLPLVGQLFRFKSRQRRNSEVLVFITPTLVPETR